MNFAKSISHNKAECPNPAVERPFTGECRLCKEVGHRAAACPSKPPETCNNCGEEGHVFGDCNKPRLDMFPDCKNLSKEEAWENLRKTMLQGDKMDFIVVSFDDGR